MATLRLIFPITLACACAIAAFNVVPRGVEAQELLFAQDDPVLLSDHQLARVFNAELAAREIEAALALDDIDRAQSFLDLPRDRNVTLAPALVGRVEAAGSTWPATRRAVKRCACGLTGGNAESSAAHRGPATAGLFVSGDIRDA